MMRDGLQTYAEYNDSGTPSVAAIPSHWRMVRIKRILREMDRRSTDGSGTLLSLTRVRGLIRQSDMSEKGTTAATLVGYKLCFPGDVVMNRMQAWSGMFGIGTEAGLVSPDYAVFRPLADSIPTFLVHALRSPHLVAQFAVESKGIGSGFNRLYTDKFGAIAMPLPPPAEQTGIVRFLTAVDRRVNRFIRAKRRLVEVLTEQKQAIITHAVTRGLNPTTPLKPSGIDWLGDVPDHWEVWQIGHFAAVGNGSTPSRGNAAYWSGGAYPWLNSSSVHAGTIAASNQFVTDTALRECHLPRVPAGSLLVAITGQGKTRGTAAVLTIEATINQHIAFITPRKREKTATPEYLRAFFVAAYSELRRMSDDSGSTKGALTCEYLRHFRVALPPLEEQERIVQWTRDATAEVEAAMSLASREIDLIREYRTRLVADVVTGKLDVRRHSWAQEESAPAAADETEAVPDYEGIDGEVAAESEDVMEEAADVAN